MTKRRGRAGLVEVVLDRLADKAADAVENRVIEHYLSLQQELQDLKAENSRLRKLLANKTIRVEGRLVDDATKPKAALEPTTE